MSKIQLKKYQRVLTFQQKKCDLVKRRLAAQQDMIVGLKRQQQELHEQMTHVELQFGISTATAMLNQHCGLAMMQIQKKINAKKEELATASGQLDQLLHEFREQDKQLKSWERLIEQVTTKLNAAASILEMKLADERYLSTRFAGDPL